MAPNKAYTGAIFSGQRRQPRFDWSAGRLAAPDSTPGTGHAIFTRVLSPKRIQRTIHRGGIFP
jgi:hypothetical protein